MTQPIDITPFSLPNAEAGVTRFEDPRDIERVVVRYKTGLPARLTCDYLRKIWPNDRFERSDDADLHKPGHFGWSRIDDPFNATWSRARTRIRRLNAREAEITFQGLHREIDEYADREKYNVTYRRTYGIRLPGAVSPSGVQIYTRSAPISTRLRIELDAGRRTPGTTLALTGYNAQLGRAAALTGITRTAGRLRLGSGKRRRFEINVDHMTPAFRYAYDEGHVKVTLDTDAFTISLDAMDEQGPIWFADKGIYICRADDPRNFADYRNATADHKTVSIEVSNNTEQSLGGAMRGQPRPHALGMVLGCRHCREMFIQRENGDLQIPNWPICLLPGVEKDRFKNDGDGRLCLGLDEWISTGRHHDAFPLLAYNLNWRRNNITLSQKAFAVPIMEKLGSGTLRSDALLATLIRLRFKNEGTTTQQTSLRLRYSDSCVRWLSSAAPHAPLRIEKGWLQTRWKGRYVNRARMEGRITTRRLDRETIELSRRLAPGQVCEVVFKVPYIVLDSPAEKRALAGLDFTRAHREMAGYWRRQPLGGEVHTPEARIDEAYRGHLPAVYSSDYAEPDDPDIVNTSVGAACYMNYTNEACMILEDLDQRGLHQETRKRINVWLKYQSTCYLMGRFVDFDGLLFGAGGVQQGESYNQHHGWALWIIAEHYFLSGDSAWLRQVAPALIKGVDWVHRQCRETLKPLPFSRGWEKGFMPAGALEDVDDYFYWLSTNCLTWRGVDTAARALAAIGHEDAARLQKDADRFRRHLVRGFETQRQHTPLIRLRDGRWIPHYPSRLYRRGRDYGWIREVLEGSVYLLISGLFKPNSKQAQWILDDFQDTRYMNPPHGYPVAHQGPVPPALFSQLPDPLSEWYHQGGFSFQPNLLPGLMPHLDRDEIEIYIWMFFNAWNACYREEVGSMAEHPLPVLGYSNYAPAKTSDQSNAMKWLRYMFVYAPEDTLHIGRAIPRKWFTYAQPIGIEDVTTRFGKVSVAYTCAHDQRTIEADIKLSLRSPRTPIVVRFRHPENQTVKRVLVNGKRHTKFDASSGDVHLDCIAGRIRVRAIY